MSIKKRLVLTFDAFGTLFIPRQSIGKAYANVAAKHGLPGLVPVQVNEKFKNAFREAQQKYPNYGKAVNIGPKQWWTNVIEATFAPFIKSDKLPGEVVLDLLRLFSTKEGYQRFPDVLPCFTRLRSLRSAVLRRPETTYEIIVGIITNSDDRVLSILQSLSLPTSHRRFLPGRGRSALIKRTDNAFDFVVTSYDTGAAKPDRRIFDAAKLCAALPDDEKDVEHIYLHIGDDPIKDYQAAIQAGWEAACVGGYGRTLYRKPEDSSMLFLENLYALDSYVANEVLGLRPGELADEQT